MVQLKLYFFANDIRITGNTLHLLADYVMAEVKGTSGTYQLASSE